jgi:hypothetical protein
MAVLVSRMEIFVFYYTNIDVRWGGNVPGKSGKGIGRGDKSPWRPEVEADTGVYPPAWTCGVVGCGAGEA